MKEGPAPAQGLGCGAPAVSWGGGRGFPTFPTRLRAKGGALRRMENVEKRAPATVLRIEPAGQPEQRQERQDAQAQKRRERRGRAPGKILPLHSRISFTRA